MNEKDQEEIWKAAVEFFARALPNGDMANHEYANDIQRSIDHAVKLREAWKVKMQETKPA